MIGSTHKHLVALQRRLQYLEEKLAGSEGTSGGARQYMENELNALRAAVTALTYHRNVIQRLDEPVGLLQEIVHAYDGPIATNEARLRVAIGRARGVLEEFEILTNQLR